MDEQYRKMLYELSLQEAIQQQLDELVRLSTQTVVSHINLDRMEKSQLRNVVNVAATAESVEVVTNFIRYQIGRNEKQAWRGRTDFGHEVIKTIDGPVKMLADNAVGIMQEHLKQKGISEEDLKKLESQKKKLAHQQLTEFYLGYLNRCFYYAKETAQEEPTGISEMRAALEATNAK